MPEFLHAELRKEGSCARRLLAEVSGLPAEADGGYVWMKYAIVSQEVVDIAQKRDGLSWDFYDNQFEDEGMPAHAAGFGTRWEMAFLLVDALPPRDLVDLLVRERVRRSERFTFSGAWPRDLAYFLDPLYSHLDPQRLCEGFSQQDIADGLLHPALLKFARRRLLSDRYNVQAMTSLEDSILDLVNQGLGMLLPPGEEETQ